MDTDKTDQASHRQTESTASRKARSGLEPGLPPQELSPPDVDPATSAAEEDDEARLPELEEGFEAVGDGPLSVGHDAIEKAVRLPPPPPRLFPRPEAAQHELLC